MAAAAVAGSALFQNLFGFHLAVTFTHCKFHTKTKPMNCRKCQCATS